MATAEAKALLDRRYDAVVIGSGPNGMAAAITLAREHRSVLVIEAEAIPGGGARSAELTRPGFVHDLCSAIHPLGVASPFFRNVPLADHGLEWLHPDAPLAHPLNEGPAVMLERSIEKTAHGLGMDGPAWQRLLGHLSDHASELFEATLQPLRLIPRSPLLLARFGLRAIRPASSLARSWFKTDRAKGLFAGIAAHAVMPLERMLTSAIALMLGISGHAVGWPMPKGGAQKITESMISYLRSLGGEIVTGHRIDRLEELPPAGVYLFDVAPRNLVRICGRALPAHYRKKLLRFRHGPAVFKLDWALDGPIPWKAEGAERAGTVHLGGTLEEIAEAERAAWNGFHHPRPYVLVAQQSLFDPTRAPEGKHTGWAYCHVPRGSQRDCTEMIENQMERFAPGFRDLVLARSVMSPQDFERRNANFIGGDISGGVMDLWQAFFRPTLRPVPYSTPHPKIFLCSSSTPPGSGVHGMCGYHAAQAALRAI